MSRLQGSELHPFKTQDSISESQKCNIPLNVAIHFGLEYHLPFPPRCRHRGSSEINEWQLVSEVSCSDAQHTLTRREPVRPVCSRTASFSRSSAGYSRHVLQNPIFTNVVSGIAKDVVNNVKGAVDTKKYSLGLTCYLIHDRSCSPMLINSMSLRTRSKLLWVRAAVWEVSLRMAGTWCSRRRELGC